MKIMATKIWSRFVAFHNYGFICYCLSLTLCFFAFPSQSIAQYPQQLPVYDIKANYLPDKSAVDGNMTLILMKEQAETQDNYIYFHLYPNAFRSWKYDKENTPTKPGFIDVTNVLANGVAVPYRVLNDTLLQIDLTQITKTDKLTVNMDYHLQIPEKGMRLTQNDKEAFLAQWYPMLAVRDNKGWHFDPYTDIGDPFYTRLADFYVTLNVPDGYQIVSTGNNPQTTKNTTIVQKGVRDFAVFLTPTHRMLQKTIDNVRVNLWYKPTEDYHNDFASILHKAAINSMQFYSQKFGQYPYEEIDVVIGETGAGVAGMEYPGLITSIFALQENKNAKAEPAINVVAHEMAHQWFYGIVGNDQVNEPWVDEGLTTFAEFLYMYQKEHKNGLDFLSYVSDKADDIYKKTGLGVTEAVYKYPPDNYAIMVYLRPAAMLFDLSKQLGSLDKVIAMVKQYYEQYRYDIARGCDFLAIAEQTLTDHFIQQKIDSLKAKQMAQAFFKKWLYKLPFC